VDKTASEKLDMMVRVVADLQRQLNNLTEKYDILANENISLREENTALKTEITQLRSENIQLKIEIEDLKKTKKGPPIKFKANVKSQAEPSKRKKRGFGKARLCVEFPDEVIDHKPTICPDCQIKFQSEGWLAHSKDVLTFPKEPSKNVRHNCHANKCGICGKTVIAKPDSKQNGIVGNHKIDAYGMSLIAYWHITCRIPLNVIKKYLESIYNIKISLGCLVNIMKKIAEKGKNDYEKILSAIRESPAVHMDETGWRENGHNGYIWAAVTDKERYFMYSKSRSGDVAVEILGKNFDGVVICDGYGGYNKVSTHIQRCWVHLLRHGHDIKEKYLDNNRLSKWIDKIKQIYEQACKLKSSDGYADVPEYRREKKRLHFENLLINHVNRLKDKDVKEAKNLAAFLTNHRSELFVFLQVIECASENNPAERALRPEVIDRKVCGGTRSAEGSATKMILFSLFETLKIQEKNIMESITNMLLGTPLFD
jgi:transposase/cell division protein FtsB